MARGYVQGDVERGGFTVSTDGRTSTTLVQRSFPSATVTVFNAGTATPSSIFSDSGGTPKANPFTADTDGQWNFWANPGSYDVQFSGTGVGITSPYTRFAFFVPDTAVTAPIPDPGSNGILARTALQVVTPRTITGTANEITVSNGDGVAGNPTISIPAAVTFTAKTITGGAYLPTTISGGTHTSATALSIRSSGSAFDLAFANTEIMTANRTLTLALNDSNRSMFIGGTITFGSNFTTTPANAVTLTTTSGTNVTLPTTGTLATLAGTETFTNKTLTTPRIGTSILDTNGNELFLLTATGSAVNEFTITNAATGNSPILETTGTDANVGMIVRTKNTGNISLRTSTTEQLTLDGSSAALYLGNGITNATPPSSFPIGATGGSGSNIAGTTLVLAGGKGTGNAEPGAVGVRYPLRLGSGTTLQSLSASTYPVVTALYTLLTANTISNTVAETSLFTGESSSVGSTRSVEAGITKLGTVYRVRLHGNITNTGTPTIRFRIKLGSIGLADTGAVTMSTITGVGHFWIEYDLVITLIGATGTYFLTPLIRYTTSSSGLYTVVHLGGAATASTVDFTAAQAIDVTVEFGTANVSNAIQLLGATIERIR